MNKPKTFKTWRIVGIILTALVIIAGFAGSYALGVSRGALIDGDWEHPMSRNYEEGEGYYPMPMHGYYRGYRSPIGGIFGFFLMILVVGAFLRLLFFPFRMARRAMWGRHHCCPPRHHFHHMHNGHHGFHGPHSHWDKECCGEKQADEEYAEEDVSSDE